MFSVLYNRKTSAECWNKVNGVVKRSRGKTATHSRWGYHSHSLNGIYVYLSRKQAEYVAKTSGRHCVVLEVEVDPEDHIYSSHLGGWGRWTDHNRKVRTATYEKVTVKEDQTYIDWYD
jgi:hypothetical protein